MNVFRARRTLIWGVVSVVVGAALAMSFVLAGGAVSNAENDAKQRAEGYANSVLYKALTPGMVGQPIDGKDYGDVLVQVQAGILNNNDVVRVRVWNRSGQLVFSSDQRDRLGQQAGFGGVLKKVFDGSTVSDVTGPRVAPEPGLAGTNEQLLLSYVPLRLGSQTSPTAAVEIDQRYSAILAAAHVVWRPLQIALGVLLLFALGMLLVSFRSGAVPSGAGLAGDPRAAERLRSLEKQTKELEKRAREAADRAKQADDRVRAAEERADAMTKAKTALEQQLASAERNLRDTLTASRSNQDDATALSARLPELERENAELRARTAAAESVVPGVSAEELAAVQTRAREAEGERDRFAREIERLNIAMSESNAAYNRATELETRLAEVQALGSDADSRVAAAQARAAELETRVAEAEARALGSEQRLADSDRRLAEIEQRSKSSVDQAQVDLDRISIRLSETQAALAESTDRMTKLQSDLQRVQQEKDDAVAELQRAGLATGERDQEVERLRAAITERDQQSQDLQRTVLERNAELEQLRNGLGERSGEADHARAETAAKAAELDQLRAEAVAKNAELDQLRAESASRATELEQLRAESASGATELDRLRADLTARTAELDALRNDSTSRSSEAESLRAELSSRTAELDQVRQDLSARSEELEQLHETVTAGSSEAETLRARIAELEQAAAASTTTGADLDQARTALSSKDEELEQLRDAVAGRDAELQRVRAELEQVAAQPSAASGDADGDELRRRVGELEDLRRTDIAEVQQAHEQLANAQLELRQARERIEDLEDRARKFAAASVEAGIPFQQGGNGAHAEPEMLAGEAVTSPDSPVFEPPDEATVGSRLSAFRKRRVSSRLEDVPVPAEQWEPPVIAAPHDEPEEHHDDPPMPEITPEGLSLRERLTRAAAARHRVTTPSDTEQH
jgi:predicted  nucleic acid-binding Zn-ribbon protein